MSVLFDRLLPVFIGPFVGSFLGVLVLRLPLGQPVVAGRSHCDRCDLTLGPLDLVPLLSWALLRGHCRRCGGRLTPFYPAIEGAALIIAIWTATISQGWLLWTGCALGWTLLTLALIDQRNGLLPDALTLPLIPLGLATAALQGLDAFLAHAIGAAAGFAVLEAIRRLYKSLRGWDGLGFGDVKLLATAGAFVAWDGLPSVILIGAVTTLAVILAAPLTDRTYRPEQHIPFGPGLCLGIWLTWLYGPLG